MTRLPIFEGYECHIESDFRGAMGRRPRCRGPRRTRRSGEAEMISPVRANRGRVAGYQR